jgi:hypothetical protein
MQRASSRAASTAFVVGRSTAAGTDLVATSTSAVSSTLPTTPSSSSTATSRGVESICVSSPGRTGNTAPNGPSGCWDRVRRVRADPVACLPSASLFTSRLKVAFDGTGT